MKRRSARVDAAPVIAIGSGRQSPLLCEALPPVALDEPPLPPAPPVDLPPLPPLPPSPALPQEALPVLPLSVAPRPPLMLEPPALLFWFGLLPALRVGTNRLSSRL